MSLTIEELNRLSSEEYQEKFKSVIVDSDAEIFTSVLLPFRNVDQIVFAFFHYLNELNNDQTKQLLQKQPELDESEFNQLLLEENGDLDKIKLENFQRLKKEYKEKFGFPYIVSCLEKSRDFVIRNLNRRLDNTLEEEEFNGVSELKKICQERIQRIVRG